MKLLSAVWLSTLFVFLHFAKSQLIWTANRLKKLHLKNKIVLALSLCPSDADSLTDGEGPDNVI